MSISTIRRQVKNVAYNFSDAQVKVREATSNDPWGPTTVLMSEIADMTNNPMAFTEIMSMLWKRLNDHGKNWRHVYKSLILLDYLIKCGNEKVAQQCRENIFSIETLRDFQHIEDNRDQGMNVREKAKQMVILLNDEERLKNERARFQMTRKRFIANGSGISSDGNMRGRRGESAVVDSELEEARPSSIGEEEMQLQIALALSREECAKEEEMRRGDDVRLQIALEESKRNNESPQEAETNGFSDTFSNTWAPEAQKEPKTGLESALQDLMELNLCDPAPTSTNAPTLNDPWGVSAAANDPWSAPPANDPWSVPTTVDNSSLYPMLSQPQVVSMSEGSIKDPFGTNTFLGESSNLVNFDNLMGPAPPVLPPRPASETSNPFMSVSTNQAATNPFSSSKPGGPSINELMMQRENGFSAPKATNPFSAPK